MTRRCARAREGATRRARQGRRREPRPAQRSSPLCRVSRAPARAGPALWPLLRLRRMLDSRRRRERLPRVSISSPGRHGARCSCEVNALTARPARFGHVEREVRGVRGARGMTCTRLRACDRAPDAPFLQAGSTRASSGSAAAGAATASTLTIFLLGLNRTMPSFWAYSLRRMGEGRQ